MKKLTNILDTIYAAICSHKKPNQLDLIAYIIFYKSSGAWNKVNLEAFNRMYLSNDKI